jgi:23S rRNA (cytosine1962-C5)-methyltransferase
VTGYPSADVRLNPRGLARWRSGHPWIYRGGIEMVEESTGAEAIARVHDPRGRFLGQSLLSRESQITLRFLTRREEPVNAGFIGDRLGRAAAFRERHLPGRDAVRLVFGEADGLPGLVVDRYGRHLAVQFLAWGMDALSGDITEALRGRIEPESILARNDPAVRGLEGLPRAVTQLYGETPDAVTYHEGDLELSADLRRGQKTGAFLDQVENHLLAGRLAHGRVLDVFTYTGGFALAAARNAESVTAVDTSADALQIAQTQAARNGLENVTFVEANAFDYLKDADRRGDRVDMVILDPPAFAKNKGELDGALRGYKEINLRAMKILKPGGILLTCSCSYHLSEQLMDEVLSTAAADAHRAFRVLERRRQAPDHPVLLGFPESLYLKCQVLELLD